jgi:subtilisin-like proprotein convertase family protein
MRTRGLRLFAAALAALALVFVPGAGAGVYTNSTPLPVPDATGFNPIIPGEVTSTIQVTETATITSVLVRLNALTSQAPDDLDIALTSPANTKVILMSDAGGCQSGPCTVARDKPDDPIASPINIMFSDSGAPLPDNGAITTGTYHPDNFGTTPGFFCTNETDQTPTVGGQPTLSTFNGQQANGTWTLIVQDDCPGFLSSIANGWCLIINTPAGACPATAVAVRVLSATPGKCGTVVRWTTGNEATALGYNLYRSTPGRLVKLNRALIRAKASGAARGASYRVVDHGFRRTAGVTYRVQAVERDGSRTWVGSVSPG